MARKSGKNQPALLPDLVDAPQAPRLRPLPASVQALFLPALIDNAARNMQIGAYDQRRADAHAVFLPWIDKLRAGLLRDLSETQVEQDFTTGLLAALGYATVGQVLPGQPWSMQPKWTFPGGGIADVALGQFTHDTQQKVQGDILAVVELKGARVDLDRHDPATRRTPVQQAWDYLTASETARWAIVSNYAEIRLYHRDKGRNHVHRVALEDLTDPGAFARFFAVFHADSLLSDARLTLHAAELLRQTAEKQQSVGNDLYQLYDEQRYRLIQVLRHEKGVADLDTAIETAQKLLDRVLFIAFAEDRRLLDDARLLENTFALRVPLRSAWENFQSLFRALDRGDARSNIPMFDGSLFAPDPLLDDPAFTLDDTWPQVFQTIGQFDFRDEVSVEVLGHLFERSITDLEALKAEGPDAYRAAIEERAAARREKKAAGRRKREGVFYTARFIVEYLVGAALDPAWDAARREVAARHGIDPNAPDVPADVLRAWLARLDDFTVCDPACGSGAFLIGAYDWFEDRRMALLDALDAADPDAPECAGGREDWRGRCAETILRRNLYGVDLAAESVEIARLSLWIRTARKGQALTDLTRNVVQGNSVVDDPTIDPRAFRWDERFPEVFARGGFDAVVGNPPYVRQERLSAIKPHLERSFRAYHGMADLYVYFHERGLQILRPGGRLAFVVTNKWMKAGYGEPLRRLFGESAWVEQVVDFGHAKGFFPDADVFPCFLVVRKPTLPVDDAPAPEILPSTGGESARGGATDRPAPAIGDADAGASCSLPPGGGGLGRGGRHAHDLPTRTAHAAAGGSGSLSPGEGGLGRGGRHADPDPAPGESSPSPYPPPPGGRERQAPSAGPGEASGGPPAPAVGEDRMTPPRPGPATARVCVISRDAIPRANIQRDDIARLVAGASLAVERDRFGAEPWNLEPKAVGRLVTKLRQNGKSLAQYAGAKPLSGIKTGLNEAFLIDTPAKIAMVTAEPSTAELLRPYLRGHDIERWHPDWAGLWMIALKSSGDHPWPWADLGDDAEATFAATYPSVHAHLKPFEAHLRTRQDKGRYWWELRACAYWDLFEQDKIVFPEITWRLQWGLDTNQMLINNTAYVLPASDTWIVAVLNSPTCWWYSWRNAIHGKDEALRFIREYVETIPVCSPPASSDADAYEIVERLRSLAEQAQSTRRTLLDWIQVQHEVTTPSTRLRDPIGLTSDAFVAEVQKARGKRKGLSSAALKSLRDEYAQTIEPARALAAEAAQLEIRLHDLVNAAYGLTPDEVRLMWDTAPPRMPIPRPPGV
jgi:hypothetical protein